jgi:hypothetical protein
MAHPDTILALVNERIEMARVQRLAYQSDDGEEVWVAEDSVDPLLYWATGSNQFRALASLKSILTRVMSDPTFFVAKKDRPHNPELMGTPVPAGNVAGPDFSGDAIDKGGADA